MKNVFLLFLAIISMTIFFTSCEDRFKEISELRGNELASDTVVVRDTTIVEKVVVKDSIVYVEVRDTVTVDKDLIFDCYYFNNQGNLVITDIDANDYVVSYNVAMETSGNIFFKEENEAEFTLKSKTSKFSGNKASFTVLKGGEQVTLDVLVKGANSIIINGEEITPCDGFTIEAELHNMQDILIDGKGYQRAVVVYSFSNGEGEIVCTAKQNLFAPKAKPENERKITIIHHFEDGNLVIDGTIDNSLFSDTVAQIIIPLVVTISCEEVKTVEGNSFDFSLGANPREISSKIADNRRANDNFFVVSYNEIRALYAQNVTASGKEIVLNQQVSYFNDFVVEFGGESREIKSTLFVEPISTDKGTVKSEGDFAKQHIDITYQATNEGAKASDVQGLEIYVKAIDFEGSILYANRTVTFDAIKSPRVYDCVITDAQTYYYREIVNGQALAWNEVSLSTSEYNFILGGMKQKNSALAIYFHKNVEGPKVGYLVDYLASDKQVIYFSHNNPHATVDNINFVMFGTLETPILGTAVSEGPMMRMVCEKGVYNGNIISPAEILYFVK